MPAPITAVKSRVRTPRPRWLPVLLAIAAALHVVALVRAVPLQSANDRSRWATVWALAERGTFRIDAIDQLDAWRTIDKVQVDGHLYSSKPALLTVMTAGVYRALRAVTGWSIIDHTAPVTQTILGLINLVPWIAAWLAIVAMVRKYARGRFTQAYVVGTAAFGTFLSTYSVTFNNHTIAAVSLIFALFFATRIVINQSRRPHDFLCCGLTAAFVTTNELPAALCGLSLFGLLVWHDWRRTLLLFVPAAIVPICAFFITTWMQTGSWKPFYLSYGTETYIFIRDGIPSYWANPRGIDQNLDSPPAYLFHCILGHHGILSLSPVFFLTVAGWCLWRRISSSALRPFIMMGLGLTVAIIAFYMTRTENYNYGGHTAALRWALWLTPFWIIGLIPVVDAFSNLRWFRGVAVALLAISTFSAWEAIDNPWRPSWLFRAMEAAELIDYSDPPATLHHDLSTIFSTLPPEGTDPENEWVELTTVTGKGEETIRLSLVSASKERVRMRWERTELLSGITDQSDLLRSSLLWPKLTSADMEWTPLETGTRVPTRELETFTATWDRTAFEAGDPSFDALVEADPNREIALSRVWMGPLSINLRPRRMQYIKIPGHEFAFRATQTTSMNDVQRETGEIIRHRVDAWFCPDVPFGVIRAKVTLLERRSNQVLEQRDYILSATGRREIPNWVREIESLR